MRLLLIRHGETPANVAGVLDAAVPGPGLTERGEAQARAVVDAVADEDVAAIFVSDMTRTHLTAAPLAAARDLVPRELGGLREISAGSLQGATDLASVHAYLGTLRAWGDGRLDTPMPGGPDGLDFFARYDAAVAEIEASNAAEATVVAFSHGAAIRVWCGGRCTNIDPEFAGRHDLHNTGIVVVEGSSADGWELVTWMGEAPGVATVEPSVRRDPTGEAFD